MMFATWGTEKAFSHWQGMCGYCFVITFFYYITHVLVQYEWQCEYIFLCLRLQLNNFRKYYLYFSVLFIAICCSSVIVHRYDRFSCDFNLVFIWNDWNLNWWWRESICITTVKYMVQAECYWVWKNCLASYRTYILQCNLSTVRPTRG
jgi:hypothetical protein